MTPITASWVRLSSITRLAKTVSTSIHGGQSYPNFWGYEKLTAKWSAGLIYGYVEPWEHKVPLNHNGFSPGFVPALSWKLGSGYEAQVSFPGGAGLMFHLQVPLSAAGN